jgi:anti-sigma B factor antagonist
VVTLPEHIGISNAGQVREELLSLINRGATTLIADMTATVSCDHAGADAVIRAWQRATASGTELRLVVTAQVVARVLSLVGLDRTVSVYPSLDAATAARLPAAAGARAEGRPGRGSGDITAVQQAHLRMLDAVIAGLSRAELSLQAALDLPADPARKRIEEALDDLGAVIRNVRNTTSAARGRLPPPRIPRRLLAERRRTRANSPAEQPARAANSQNPDQTSPELADLRPALRPLLAGLGRRPGHGRPVDGSSVDGSSVDGRDQDGWAIIMSEASPSAAAARDSPSISSSTTTITSTMIRASIASNNSGNDDMTRTGR